MTSHMDGGANVGEKPYLTAFLQPYPIHLYPTVESEENLSYKSLEELQAALSRMPPTLCITPGKLRPGGFNRNGKLLPTKAIPSKSDKRAGK